MGAKKRLHPYRARCSRFESPRRDCQFWRSRRLRSNSHWRRHSSADQITSLREWEDAINALFVRHRHPRGVVRGKLPLPVVADQGQLDLLSGYRAPAGVADPPCDHASSLEYEVELFDFLAFRNVDQFLPHWVWGPHDDQIFVGQDFDAIASLRNPGDMITALLISDGMKRLHPASLAGPSLRQEFRSEEHTSELQSR